MCRSVGQHTEGRVRSENKKKTFRENVHQENVRPTLIHTNPTFTFTFTLSVMFLFLLFSLFLDWKMENGKSQKA